jgi:hypothetical protein
VSPLRALHAGVTLYYEQYSRIFKGMIEFLTRITKTSNALNIGNLEVSPMFPMKYVLLSERREVVIDLTSHSPHISSPALFIVLIPSTSEVLSFG